ncbi:MAG: GNAT family N-acetyltransferase, partial [Oscillospiraceae bacterium]|nr:GNAT family N-acetyltransferase [Oscillospiraceae bacterium]
YTVANGWYIDEAERKYPFLLHQRFSRLIAERDFGITDERILSAVECHSTLKANPSVYDMALFVADKLAWDQEGVSPFYEIVTSAQSLEAASLTYMDYIVAHKMILHPHKWFKEGMNFLKKIEIKQAAAEDIPVIEAILLDTVTWLNEMGQPLWTAEEVTWERLSKSYQIEEFYIAYLDGLPSGCMVIMDYDPFFWPDLKKGESLIVHKLAIVKNARKAGVADALMDFFKQQGTDRGIKTIRLDTDSTRPKLRAFYERHGFDYIETRVMGRFQVAFYVCR